MRRKEVVSFSDGTRDRLCKIARRDGGPFCIWCSRQLSLTKGVPNTDGATTVDHIIPHSICRRNDRDVLVLACYRCNNKRGNMDAMEFMRFCRGMGWAFREAIIRQAIDRAWDTQVERESAKCLT